MLMLISSLLWQQHSGGGKLAAANLLMTLYHQRELQYTLMQKNVSLTSRTARAEDQTWQHCLCQLGMNVVEQLQHALQLLIGCCASPAVFDHGDPCWLALH